MSAGVTQSISGLASGLDTASIINQLMTIEKQPQVRIQQKIVVEQARQQAYRDVLSQLQGLQNAYQALTDPGTWGDVQTVASSDDSVVSAVRTAGAAPGSYQLAVTQLARANQFSGAFTGGATAAGGSGTLSIGLPGGTSFDVDFNEGDTLQDIASRVNSASGTPVYASVVTDSSGNSQLVLSDKTTGTAAAITGVTVTDTGGTSSGLGSFTETQAAQDATYTVNGGATRTSGSNVITNDPNLAGVTLTLKGLTPSVYVNVGNPAPDTAGIEAKVQSFVTAYNSTLSFIQDKLDEKPVANPASDADRAKGVLYGDSSLQGLLSTLRQAFGNVVSGRPAGVQTLAQVGLSTGKTTGSGTLDSDAIDGKMTLDTSTFASQLSSNFSDVKALFTNATGSYSSEGLAQRLDGILTPWTSPSTSGGLLNSEIDGESSTIKELQDQSSDWDQRLQIKQQMLQAQFTAMETALSQAQSQSSWLTSQIASLPTG